MEASLVVFPLMLARTMHLNRPSDGSWRVPRLEKRLSSCKEYFPTYSYKQYILQIKFRLLVLVSPCTMKQLLLGTLGGSSCEF